MTEFTISSPVKDFFSVQVLCFNVPQNKVPSDWNLIKQMPVNCTRYSSESSQNSNEYVSTEMAQAQ